jgi:undecaprenyl-diphosphatase
MQIGIIEYILLGLIQGIAEWLPISSSGMLTLVMSNFLNVNSLSVIVEESLFLHLGTFFAALIYFRKDVAELLFSVFKYNQTKTETKKILLFLTISTIISGILGLIFLYFLDRFETIFLLSGKSLTLLVGILLMITGIFKVKIKANGIKSSKNLTSSDGVLLGVAQGFSSFPGLSRSGITVSTLLIRKFDDTTALKLSFLMSLPIVLAGNILLNLNNAMFTLPSLIGVLTSFVFGILTIHGLIKISKRIDFGWFAIIFSILMLASIFI